MNIEHHLKYRESKNPGRERNVDEIMESVKGDLKIIMDKKRDAIDSHDYGLILGIDGGGRVPVLILRKTLNGIYASRAEKNVETCFLSGSRNIYHEDVELKSRELMKLFNDDSFQKIRADGKKILIVEDVIASGQSLEPIVKVLQELHYDYEIVTLSFNDSEVLGATYNPEIDIKFIEDKLGSEITYGGYGEVSSLYGAQQMIGVHKDPASVFSQPLRKEISLNNNTLPQAGNQHILSEKDTQHLEVLKHTRNLISKISQELITEYIR